MMIRWTLAILYIALLIACDAVWACPSCFSEAEPQQRAAYVGTTVFLSALPLMLLGFLALCLFRGSRRRDRSPEGGAHG